ncbi:MAG: HAMP domain-containing sensor histidine kinase [Pseudomonadota bacterium]
MLDQLKCCVDALTVPAFVLRVSEDGTPIYAHFNAAACAASGLRLRDVIGRTAQDIWGPWGDQTFSWHQAAVASGQPTEYYLKLPLHGRETQVRTRLIPTVEDGRVTHLLATCEVSPRQGMTTAVQQFMALAAHDLRTPLRNIRAIVDLMAASHPEETEELSRMGFDVIDGADTLLDEIVSYCRATGAVREVATFSLGELVAAARRVIDPKGRQAITVQDAVLVGDRPATQVALRNLIDNAVKYGDRRISVRAAAIEGGQVEVGVWNRGVASGDLADLVDKGCMRAGGGFGLWGVTRLVADRGGSMRLVRHLAGTEVCFSLPGKLVSASEAA